MPRATRPSALLVFYRRILRALSSSKVQRAGEGLVVTVRPAAATSGCPGCGATTSRMHGRYQRTLRDAPLAGTLVYIQSTARRLICPIPECPHRRFAEQVSGLASPHARLSPAS
jgi:transposase